MRIGELAKVTGVSRTTLRHYEKRGLIHSCRVPTGARDYPPETVALVAYIRMARRTGFSLPEIAARLPALWQAEHPDR